jgi:hypothetical protein
LDDIISVEAASEARKRKTAASEIGTEENAARTQRVAKKVNLGESATMIDPSCQQHKSRANEECKTTKAERKHKERIKVKLRANRSLVESLLDCGGCEKGRNATCGIQSPASCYIILT